MNAPLPSSLTENRARLIDRLRDETAGALNAVDDAALLAVVKVHLVAIGRLIDKLDIADMVAATDIAPGPALVFGALELSPDRAGAKWRGQVIGLTASEVRIVHALASHAGTNLTHREIFTVIRGRPDFHTGSGPNGYQSNVRSFIKRIRGKFVALDPGFAAIVNMSGVGYCWSVGP